MWKNIHTLKKLLQSLSFRTGLIVAVFCVFFYLISFAQMLLPLSPMTKAVLWTIFFGLAKASQYTAILILGKNGIQKLKKFFRRIPEKDR